MTTIEVDGKKYRVTETLGHQQCGMPAKVVETPNGERIVVKRDGAWAWWTVQDRLQSRSPEPTEEKTMTDKDQCPVCKEELIEEVYGPFFTPNPTYRLSKACPKYHWRGPMHDRTDKVMVPTEKDNHE